MKFRGSIFNKNTLICLLVLLVIILLIRYFHTPYSFSVGQLAVNLFCPTPTPTAEEFVNKVVDGDTILLENGETVRYLGIDTPETHHPEIGEECGGKEATEENRKIVLGKRVKLEKDITDKDQYGRLLRFVFTEDGEFVNYALIRKGWAQVFSIPPNKKFERVFIDAQLTAKKENLGIWRKCFNQK